MTFLLSSHDGEVMVDHRASPGIPREQAERMGLDPSTYREGVVSHMASKTCAHCNGTVILQPLRTRERASCTACGMRYICDYCDAERRKSDYVHRPFVRVVELVQSGKFTIDGPLYNPVLIPTGGQNG